MKSVCRSLLAVLILTAAATAAGPAWSLPDDLQAVVVELLYSSGPENAQQTALQLHRDGTFVGDVGTAGEVRGKLTSGEMRELLQDICETSGALQLTTSSLRDQVREHSRRTGKPALVRAAADMTVRITLADRVHEFQCPSPEVLHTRYPQLRDLDRVCAIRRRLENVVAVAHAGGNSAAERLAALATDDLRRHNGSDLRVTAGDLQEVRGQAGDLRQFQFVVRDDRSSNSAAAEVHITVLETPGAPPRISITTSAAPL